jgi:hypothetical protein
MHMKRFIPVFKFLSAAKLDQRTFVRTSGASPGGAPCHAQHLLLKWRSLCDMRKAHVFMN